MKIRSYEFWVECLNSLLMLIQRWGIWLMSACYSAVPNRFFIFAPASLILFS